MILKRLSVLSETAGASISAPCVTDTGVPPPPPRDPEQAAVYTLHCTCGQAVMSRPCGGRTESTVAGASLQRRAGRGQGMGREQVWATAAGGQAGTEEELERKWEYLG